MLGNVWTNSVKIGKNPSNLLAILWWKYSGERRASRVNTVGRGVGSCIQATAPWYGSSSCGVPVSEAPNLTTVNKQSQIEVPRPPRGPFSESPQKVLGKRRWEKVGEGRRREGWESVRESWP